MLRSADCSCQMLANTTLDSLPALGRLSGGILPSTGFQLVVSCYMVMSYFNPPQRNFPVAPRLAYRWLDTFSGEILPLTGPQFVVSYYMVISYFNPPQRNLPIAPHVGLPHGLLIHVIKRRQKMQLEATEGDFWGMSKIIA